MSDLMKSLWDQYLSNYVAVVTVVGTFATLIALYLQVRKRKRKARPRIREGRATLRIHHSRNRSSDAEALVENKGENACQITEMKLLSDAFALDRVRLSFDREVAYGTGRRGDESPLLLNGGEVKRVYMRTEELCQQYTKSLPNSVSLSIEFDGKPISVRLSRDGDRSVYLSKCEEK